MKNFWNKDLNFDEIKSNFAKDGKVRVNKVLDFEFAALSFKALNERVEFDTAMYVDGKNAVMSKKEWNGLEDTQRQQIYFHLMENAAMGNGFSYGRKYITAEEKDSFLLNFYKSINSEEVLDVIRKITGKSDINDASMQATKYIPGQFLTRHKDEVQSEGRKLAYVFNLSPEWHPDWGGLLQFFNNDGETLESWTPTFNTLSLFDVKHIHSVTYLTPFAKKPRYALTGWFGTR